ncbi:acyl-CoA dehydrogenase [Mycobacterium sp. TNTM28]|uniref:Acyl-CoA dehydrogenase n=1 Tax=[Mycobacterium] fortunisiensis TaxID=2600579 RepID=A0ABS6KIL3_9MYCO|nr:acyl-CoA dehydrogenase family protein [[Mycobacterium] fortunisiensis]MBU9763423.1 acyl-CoA dehydrogenase [[Mycobacterium] fortunisiensis]
MHTDEFRTRVRNFIAAQAPTGQFYDGVRVPRSPDAEGALRGWYASLFDAGLIGGSWPAQYGGRPDHSLRHDAVVMEEIVRARAPRPIDQVLLASHLIITFGTEAQREKYLPRIRSAEDIWCQLFSEPDVGSDLARLSTKAIERPDGTFCVDGQKVWSTDAQWSQMGVLIARTDRSAKPHAGLTVFLLDMTTPGVGIRPIREMTGSDEFCEVHLDQVVIPPEQILGELNQGWAVVNSGLASERAYVGANSVLLAQLLDDIVELSGHVDYLSGPAADDPVVSEQLADFKARVAAVQCLAADVVSQVIAGTDHPSDGLLAKLAYTELNVALCSYAMTMMAGGRLRPSGQPVAARLEHAMLWSRALTISGGSSEIVRNLIATQLLQLPRSW